MSRFRILALDGGGVRGVYTARLLEILETKRPGTLEQVDLFAGTSTGGIIALGLAMGKPPSELVSFYRDHADEVFHDTLADDIKDMGRLLGADYDQKRLKRLLEDRFGKNRRLLNLKRGKRVLISAFDLDDRDDRKRKKDSPGWWKPKFFHNFPGDQSDGAELAVDVALRTTAAPTYFPSYQGYIDGGVVANNPSMAALAQALDPDTGGQELENLRLLSIGAGRNPTYIGGEHLDWGYAQWAKKLVPLMVDGLREIAHYQCKRLLGDAYHRLDGVLPKPVALDAVGKVKDLVIHADEVDVQPTLEWLERAYG